MESMKRLKIIAFPSLLAMLALSGTLAIHAGVLGQQQQTAKPPQPPNPAFAAIQDDPALPRVLLIGDSISIGYTLPTRRLLQGVANVHRIPTNGGPTINGRENLDGWLGSGKWHVIHFNWGLNDLEREQDRLRVPTERYQRNLEQLVKRLQKTGAKLIWVTTTPVPVGKVNSPRVAADVPLYNTVAKRVMDENGIPINDLYTFCLPRIGAIQPKEDVHFSETGYRVLGEEVAEEILRLLE